MKKQKKNSIINILLIIILAIYIISPVDLMPLIEIDDGFAGILIGKLLDGN